MGLLSFFGWFWRILVPQTRLREKKEEIRQLKRAIGTIEQEERIEQEEERNLMTLVRNISSLRAMILAVMSKGKYEIFGGTKPMQGTVRSLEIMEFGLERIEKVQRATDEYHIVEQYYVEVWAQIKDTIQRMIPETERQILTLVHEIEVEFRNILQEIRQEEELIKEVEQELVTVEKEVESEE